jgi:hypothetical protein
MNLRAGAGPRIRASHCLATQRTLRASDPGALERALASLPPPVRQALTEADTLELVPAGWDVALVEAIGRELGTRATRALARATMLDSLRGPLLGTFLDGALRLFGKSPDRLFGWAGRIWGHVTSGCGAMRLVASGPATATLVLEQAPDEVARPAYLDAVAGTLEAVFEVCEVEGEVSVALQPGGARFEARWTPPRSAPEA